MGETSESTTMPCYQLGPVVTFDFGFICMPHLRHINGLPDPRNPLLRLDFRFNWFDWSPSVAVIPPPSASRPPHSFIHHPVSTLLPEQDRSACQQTFARTPSPISSSRRRLASESPIRTQPKSPCHRCGVPTSQRSVPRVGRPHQILESGESRGCSCGIQQLEGKGSPSFSRSFC